MSERKIQRQGTAGIVSLGCSKNLVDTEFIMGGLAGRGWEFTPERDGADLLVVNTCAFLDASVEESHEAIEEALEWRRRRGEGRVVVAGCLVSRCGKELEERFPAVDLFVLPGQIGRLPSWLSSASPPPGRFTRGAPSYLPPPRAERVVTSGHWAYLKISDGCDNRCSYCLIPAIRGGHRSRPAGSILREAEGLIGAGVREINLVGQDITRWGKDRGSGRLPDLVAKLSSLDGDYRLRLLYLHPERIDTAISRLLAEGGRVFPYLDVPIQHASDRVLRSMNRPYGRRRLGLMYASLRRSVPGIALRTTVMVGHPGEGRREFGSLLRFLRDHPFENLGAFVFSPQEGTVSAARPGRPDPDEAQERYHELMELQQTLAEKLWRGRRGTVTEALVLQPQGEGRWLGRAAWQAPEVDGSLVIRGSASPGEIVRVSITGSGPYDLEGVIVP